MATRRNRNRNVPARQPQGQFVAVQEAYSGPLPTPADLERYDHIVPGMAERLLTKFERQADHRMALENHVIHSESTRSNWGLVAAFVFGIAMLAVATYLIVNGYQLAGVVALVTEFLTFGGVFVYGSESRRRERRQQRQG